MADVMADRIEIQDLMVRYAMAVDGRDWDLYRSVFTSDAVIDYTGSGAICAPVDEMVPWLAAAFTWSDGPYPEGVSRAAWYGTTDHPRPELPA